MRKPTRFARDDRGSGPVTVLLILAVLALAFTAGITAVGTLASNESAGAQHAADAAALAGAGGVVDELPADLAAGFALPAEIPDLLGGSTCVQTGRVQATELAAENHATITRYCYDVYRDEVEVAVRLDYTETSTPSKAEAQASAATTFEANACSFDPALTLPTPTDDAPKPDAPPLKTWVDCGFGRLTVVWAPALGKFQFLQLPALPELLTPKLTA